jgi:hypothetical protein
LNLDRRAAVLDEWDARLSGKRSRLWTDDAELQPDCTRTNCDRLSRDVGTVFWAAKDIHQIHALIRWE